MCRPNPFELLVDLVLADLERAAQLAVDQLLPEEVGADLGGHRRHLDACLLDDPFEAAGRHPVVLLDLLDREVHFVGRRRDVLALRLLRLDALVDQRAQDLRLQPPPGLGGIGQPRRQDRQPGTIDEVVDGNDLVIDDRGDALGLLRAELRRCRGKTGYQGEGGEREAEIHAAAWLFGNGWIYTLAGARPQRTP